MSSFWWGDCVDKKKIYWSSWGSLCNPKSEGGLGFRDIESFNDALLGKQCWRIICNPDALWVKILKARYFPNCDFLQATRGSCPSWAWVSLLEGRKMLENGALWQIGNGETVKVWNDNWLPDMDRRKPTPKAILLGRAPSLVCDLLGRDDSTWNLSIYEHLLKDDDMSLIRAIPLYLLDSPDHLIWPWTKDGAYTVKSGYFWAIKFKNQSTIVHQHSSHEVDKKIWKFVWSVNLLPKICNFLWRAISSFLPTKLILSRRHLANNPCYPIFLVDDESIEHMLLLCPWTRPVWFGYLLSYLPSPQCITKFDKWFLGMIESTTAPDRNQLIIVLGITCWEIWKERWRVSFNDSIPNLVQVNHKNQLSVVETMSHQSRFSHTRGNSGNGVQVAWCPPIYPMIKVNVDGAVKL
ncbi:hypothetical protein ACFX13_008002 [Malus domestica]